MLYRFSLYLAYDIRKIFNEKFYVQKVFNTWNKSQNNKIV